MCCDRTPPSDLPTFIIIIIVVDVINLRRRYGV